MHTDIKNRWLASAGWAIAFVLGLALASQAEKIPQPLALVITAGAAEGSAKDSGKKVEKERRIIIEDLEPVDAEKGGREVAWLGIATEESTEPLTAQLDLQAGEGLVVTYVAPESPAAKAGLQKNDLLVEFDGQTLVLPAQLRKLVQMRKQGDKVSLVFYRAGKKEEASVKLGKTKLGQGLLWQDGNILEGHLKDLKRQLSEVPVGEKMKEEMERLRESLAEAGIDKDSIRVEVKRSMEEARKALQEVMRQATNAQRTFGPAVREMREIVRRGMDVDKDATIVVKSRRDDLKTIVKTDDTGTYVVVANPQKHLTAHTKDGKLAFDGEIETAEQQERVPKEIWEKVQPMLDQLKKDKAEEPEAEAKSDGA